MLDTRGGSAGEGLVGHECVARKFCGYTVPALVTVVRTSLLVNRTRNVGNNGGRDPAFGLLEACASLSNVRGAISA